MLLWQSYFLQLPKIGFSHILTESFIHKFIKKQINFILYIVNKEIKDKEGGVEWGRMRMIYLFLVYSFLFLEELKKNN